MARYSIWNVRPKEAGYHDIIQIGGALLAIMVEGTFPGEQLISR